MVLQLLAHRSHVAQVVVRIILEWDANLKICDMRPSLLTSTSVSKFKYAFHGQTFSRDSELKYAKSGRGAVGSTHISGGGKWSSNHPNSGRELFTYCRQALINK